MADTTLHHTIRDRATSRLLLARQWIERINYERNELHHDVKRNRNSDDAKYALDTWAKRVHEDVDIARTWLMKLGYTCIDRQHFDEIPHALFDESRDISFTPHIDGAETNLLDIWERKAVQS